jgi:quercetin dioxygenase-like cupin family protein
MISPYESSRIASTGVKRKARGGQGLRFYASNGWVRRRFEVNDKADASTRASTIPPDDLSRQLTLVGPSEDAKLKHVALAGGIYTMLLTGEDTAKKFCLIDMQIPPGGGPVPHRHNFEETFTVLEGECVVTFRGRKVTVRAGETANVPANAPHFIHNESDTTAHVLCTCAPAGQDAFFLAVGIPVPSRQSQPPVLSDAEKAAIGKKAQALAAQYETEFL